MFNSIFQNGTTVAMMALMAGLALVCGTLYAWIASIRLRSSKGVFVTMALLPLIIGVGIALVSKFLSDSTTATGVSRLATLAIALGLLRFRSNNGRAEELLLLLGAIISGFVFGLGYAAYAAIFTLVVAGLYVGLSYMPIFNNKQFAQEKLLKITIPETLNYADVFDDTFRHYLKKYEMVGVKTTGMGSMFRLSYRVVLKNTQEEKELIDELRTRNGNLEISILPYVENGKEL
jgi:hypothetical protein